MKIKLVANQEQRNQDAGSGNRKERKVKRLINEVYVVYKNTFI